jgi:hypothetical protein
MEACVHCGGPTPCDCWKLRLSPDERNVAQMVLLNKHLAVLDLKAERDKFLKRQKEKREARCGRRGAFGNNNASRAYYKLRFLSAKS